MPHKDGGSGSGGGDCGGGGGIGGNINATVISVSFFSINVTK